MFKPDTTPNERRKALRASLVDEKITTLPGAFNPLTARLIEDIGSFSGVYVSGAVVANDLGLPDIGLTTLSEVANRGGQIARATNLPVLIDADTGFGEPQPAPSPSLKRQAWLASTWKTRSTRSAAATSTARKLCHAT